MDSGSPSFTRPSLIAAPRLRYVALGDSYTIGTSVGAAERWPDVLVRRVADVPPGLELVANLGVDGFTSQDVIEKELPRLDGLRPGFVSLLVGVNDVVRGVPPSRYRENLTRILDALLDRLPADRIVTVGIPDYTVTPRGAAYGDPAQRRAVIEEHNGILDALAVERGIAFVAVFDVSLEAARDPALVAPDGLHPSGLQYARWVDRIAPAVRELLRA